jgi:hypothetical protein
VTRKKTASDHLERQNEKAKVHQEGADPAQPVTNVVSGSQKLFPPQKIPSKI